jgi:hypothetical protein
MPGSDLPRQQVFKLARTLDSMLAEAGIEVEKREGVQAGLHRQTAIEMLLPLARQSNDSIDEKCRELRTSPTGSDAIGSDSEQERRNRNRLRLIEAQKVDCEVLVRLTSTPGHVQVLNGRAVERKLSQPRRAISPL